MFSKIVLSICLAFCFVHNSLAKLEIVLAFTVDSENDVLTAEEAKRSYESGEYLADSYRRGFGIRDSYKDKEIDFTSGDSIKSLDLGLAMKAGTLSSESWTYKTSTQMDLEDIGSIDKKHLYYAKCPALWRQLEKDMKGAKDVNAVRKMLNKGKTLEMSDNSKRLSGGTIVFEVMVALYQQRNKTKKDQKIMLYVLPKELFTFVVSAFSPTGTKFIKRNFEKILRPTFGATFVVEIHTDSDRNNWMIKFQYRNADKFVLKPVILPGCDVKCSFDVVFDKLEPYMVYKDHIEEDCRISETLELTREEDDDPEEVKIASEIPEKVELI